MLFEHNSDICWAYRISIIVQNIEHNVDIPRSSMVTTQAAISKLKQGKWITFEIPLHPARLSYKYPLSPHQNWNE